MPTILPYSITVITRDSKSPNLSSILSGATMNNTITFKYNGKIWNPKNPEKKLKQLGITWNDVEIIEETKQVQIEEYQNPLLYEFKNNKTGETLSSIYDNLDRLNRCLNIEDWEYIGIKKYD